MTTKVPNFLKELASLVISDKSTSSFGMFRLLMTAFAPISAFLIITFLDVEEQGYLYTMYSLISISYYAELGLAQVITQLVSEAYVKSNASHDTPTLTLYTYLQFTLRSGFFLFFAVSIISILAFLFFFWGIPLRIDGLFGVFLLLSFSASVAIPNALLHGYLEACQRNVLINNIRSVEIIVRMLLLVLFLTLGYKLFAFAYATMFTAIVSILLVIGYNYTFFKKLLSLPKPGKEVLWENYRKVRSLIMPLQMRYAQTWLSGIFINALVVPLVFALEGEVAAGQLGFSIALVSVVYNFSVVLVNSQVPVFAALNSQGNLDLLVQNYTKRNQYAISMFLLACGLLMVLLLVDYTYFQFLEDRFLPLPYFLLLLLANYVRLLIENRALFVRSFKIEPFVKVAWAQALLSIILIPACTYLWGIPGTMVAILAGNFLNFFMTNQIFQKYMRKVY